MRYVLLCPLFVIAACASTNPGDLKRMPTAEVCYMSATQPEHRQRLDAEIQARKANCQDYAAEMKKMHDMEMRAGGMGEGVGDGTRPSGNTGGGGMGRY